MQESSADGLDNFRVDLTVNDAGGPLKQCFHTQWIASTALTRPSKPALTLGMSVTEPTQRRNSVLRHIEAMHAPSGPITRETQPSSISAGAWDRRSLPSS